MNQLWFPLHPLWKFPNLRIRGLHFGAEDSWCVHAQSMKSCCGPSRGQNIPPNQHQRRLEARRLWAKESAVQLRVIATQGQSTVPESVFLTVYGCVVDWWRTRPTNSFHVSFVNRDNEIPGPNRCKLWRNRRSTFLLKCIHIMIFTIDWMKSNSRKRITTTNIRNLPKNEVKIKIKLSQSISCMDHSMLRPNLGWVFWG